MASETGSEIINKVKDLARVHRSSANLAAHQTGKATISGEFWLNDLRDG